MTPIDWPSGLPCFRWEPYQVAPRPGSLEETLGMITNLSRVYTQNNEVVTCELVLNATQEPIFRTFYKTTLSMGTQWFNAEIWRNSQLDMTELLFYGAPPVFTPIAQNVVRASFTLLTRGENAPPGPPPELACPGLTIPVDGTAVGEVTSATLLWTAVSGAATYRVYVWEDGDPQPGSPTTTTADLTYEVTGLSINTTYRWVVDAVDSEGNVTSGCESATFSTDESEATIEWLSAAFTGDILGPSVTLTVIRSGDSSGAASADYDFMEGTALIGVDFVATPGTVSFAAGEVTQDIVVPLVRDYDSEVLADTPWGYWKLDEPSPASTFQDTTANNRDQSGVAGTYLYQQPDLNLAASPSLKVSGGTARICRTYNGADMDDDQPLAFEMWVKLPVSASLQTLWGVGGSHGGAQLTKCTLYRGADGVTHMYWQSRNYSGGSAHNVTKTFTTPIPQGDEVYVVAGQDTDNQRAFISVNGSAPEYVTYLVNTGPTNEEPYQLTGGGRVTYIAICSTLTPGLTAASGPASHVAFWDDVTIPNRYARWNLDASLDFVATLSNPVGAVLGAIDETTMTIEAP